MTWREGRWVDFETTVYWLEVDPQDEEKLVEKSASFNSIEERAAFMETRFDSGTVYDVKSFTESYYGGEPVELGEATERMIRGLQ